MQTGWWFNVKSAVFEPPPRLRGFGCCAASLDRAATPPGQEGLSRSAALPSLRGSSPFGAFFFQELHDGLVFQCPCSIERRAAVRVCGIEVRTGFYGHLNGLEHQGFTSAALDGNPIGTS